MKSKESVKHLATYLLHTHNLYGGIEYWEKFIGDEVERLQNGPRRELTELEVHRLAKLGGTSLDEAREGNLGAFVI